MTMTGFNLPPGCTSRMIDEAFGVGQPMALDIDRPGFAAYWDEDGNVYAGLDCSEPPKVGVLEWNNDLADEENMRAAVEFARAIIDKPGAALAAILVESCAENLPDLYRNLYKYSDCGMGLGATVERVEAGEYTDRIVTDTVYCDDLRKLPANARVVELIVSSIVEGVEQCTESRVIDLTAADATPEQIAERFSAACDAVESEASAIWNDTHGCPMCAEHYGKNFDEEAGDIPVWPDCPNCRGDGVVI